MRRLPLSTGLALVAGAALWQARLARHWTQRIPPGWATASHYIGTATYPDPKTGRRKNLGTFPTREKAQEHEKEIQYFKRH